MSVKVDLVHARVAFRDRPLADVLDLALRFLAVEARAYATVALATLLPLLLLALAAAWLWGAAIGWLVAIPLSIAAQVPFTVLASRLVFSTDVRVRDVLKAAARDAFRVVFLRLLALSFVVFGLLFFVVPGVWVAVVSLFLGEVVLLERATLGATLARALRVASSAIGEVLLALMALTALPVVAVLLADIAGRGVLSELLQFTPPSAVWTHGWSVLAFIGLFAVAPYAATARFFVYLNVRTRVEGWDIQTRFAAIASRATRAAGGDAEAA
jgi:hypothetical protein